MKTFYWMWKLIITENYASIFFRKKITISFIWQNHSLLVFKTKKKVQQWKLATLIVFRCGLNLSLKLWLEMLRVLRNVALCETDFCGQTSTKLADRLGCDNVFNIRIYKSQYTVDLVCNLIFIFVILFKIKYRKAEYVQRRV